MFPVILIIFSIISLLVNFYLMYMHFRNADSFGKQIVKAVLHRKRFEMFFNLLAYSVLLVGALAILSGKEWGRVAALFSLSSILIYVLVDNIYSIFYFLKLKGDKSPKLKAEVSAEVDAIFEPLKDEINIEAVFGEGVYGYAANKGIKKAIGRLVVGVSLIGWGIFYLL